MARAVSAGLAQVYTAASGRKFGLVLATPLLALAALMGSRQRAGVAAALALPGALLVLMALLAPTRLQRVEAVWMSFAHLLSRVTTPLLMGIIYFVIISPIAIMRRGLGLDGLRREPGAQGYWIDRTASPRSSLERMF